MKIQSTASGYMIENGGGHLDVDSPGLGTKAMTTFEGDELMIKVKMTLMHFISPQFIIYENEREIGKITIKYFGGNFKIAFFEGSKEQTYIVKSSKKRFTLMDVNKQTLLTIHTKFSIRQMESFYEAEISPELYDLSYHMKLVFYTMFCVFYSEATGKGSVGA